MSDETKEGGGLSYLRQLLGDGKDRPSRLIPFPGWRGRSKEDGGLEAKVRLWDLGFDQISAAYQEAWKYLTEKLKLSIQYIDAHPDTLDVERKVQTLLLALRHPDEPSRPLARHAVEIRELHPDEISALYTAWLAFHDQRSPLERIESVKQMEEQLDALGKGLLEPTFLNSYDTVSLWSIIAVQAKQSVTLREELTKLRSGAISPASGISSSSASKNDDAATE